VLSVKCELCSSLKVAVNIHNQSSKGPTNYIKNSHITLHESPFSFVRVAVCRQTGEHTERFCFAFCKVVKAPLKYRVPILWGFKELSSGVPQNSNVQGFSQIIKINS
jgi:hypothetical protein